MITLLPLEERRRAQIEWIVQAVDCFVTCLKGHTDADVSAACGVAYENFSRGESGARSIYLGFDHARRRIRERSQCLQPYHLSLQPNHPSLQPINKSNLKSNRSTANKDKNKHEYR